MQITAASPSRPALRVLYNRIDSLCYLHPFAPHFFIGGFNMLVAKQVADLITIARVLIAPLLIWLGAAQGEASLPLAVWLMIGDWTGDLVDGIIARRSRRQYETWIGSHDLEADIVVSLGLMIYLLVVGYVDLPVVGVYLLFWALVFWRWGFHRPLGMLLQAPIYMWFLVVALQAPARPGLWILAWMGAVTIITWPKAIVDTVPGFLDGMREAIAAYKRDE
jgi:phosphatidylglycerophosphate synthase